MRPGISHIVRISHCFPKIALPIGLSGVFLSTVHLLDVFKTYTPLLPNSTHKVARSDFSVSFLRLLKNQCTTHVIRDIQMIHMPVLFNQGGRVFSIFIPLYVSAPFVWYFLFFRTFSVLLLTIERK